MAVYSRDLPDGWWDAAQFHVKGHAQWAQSKWDLDNPAVIFMQEILSDAAAQGVEWVNCNKPGVRAELFDWAKKPNLSVSNFTALRQLRHLIGVSSRAQRVEADEGLSALTKHKMAGQF